MFRLENKHTHTPLNIQEECTHRQVCPCENMLSLSFYWNDFSLWLGQSSSAAWHSVQYKDSPSCLQTGYQAVYALICCYSTSQSLVFLSLLPMTIYYFLLPRIPVSRSVSANKKQPKKTTLETWNLTLPHPVHTAMARLGAFTKKAAF